LLGTPTLEYEYLQWRSLGSGNSAHKKLSILANFYEYVVTKFKFIFMKYTFNYLLFSHQMLFADHLVNVLQGGGPTSRNGPGTLTDAVSSPVVSDPQGSKYLVKDGK
jgi:hypothetical protein